MVKFIRKRRRLFDEEADWVPPKGRAFKLKAGAQPEDDKPEDKPEDTRPEAPEAKGASPLPEDKPKDANTITDAEGLDKAYADKSNIHLDSQGTLYVAGTKGNFFQNEWLENYKTMGVPLVEKMLGLPSDYKIEDNERYKQIDDFMKAHPGEVKNMVGHSKGGAVIDVWMKNHPEFGGKSRLYGTPYEDILGKEEWKDRLNTFNAVRNAEYEGSPWKNPAEKWLEDKVVKNVTSFLGFDKVKGMRERGETRLAANYDPAAVLDSSAKVSYDPNWLSNAAMGFGHDYHYIASQHQGFECDGSGLNHGDRPGRIDKNYRTPEAATAPKMMNATSAIDNTVKTSWDTQPFNPFGITPAYLTYDNN